VKAHKFLEIMFPGKHLANKSILNVTIHQMLNGLSESRSKWANQFTSVADDGAPSSSGGWL
jgi:hypothetical protein